MKTLMIRAFVVALVLTGTAATAHSKTTGHVLKATTANGLPPAMCLPGPGVTCGID